MGSTAAFGLDAILLVARGLVLVAACAIVPLGLLHAASDEEGSRAARTGRLARLACRVAAPPLALALLVPAGPLAVIATLPWLVATVVVALHGLARLIARGRRGHALALAEVCIDVGCAYLPVGAAWLVVYRSDASVLGFSGVQALLTANHFHYAGFGACVLVGALGRALGGSPSALPVTFRLAAFGTMAGVILVAIGITWLPAFERVAAWALLASLVLAASHLARIAARASLGPRVLLGAASLSGLVAASLAVHFSMRGFAALDPGAFRRMVLFHGLVNALGLVGCGLAGLAWDAHRRAAHAADAAR